MGKCPKCKDGDLHFATLKQWRRGGEVGVDSQFVCDRCGELTEFKNIEKRWQN